MSAFNNFTMVGRIVKDAEVMDMKNNVLVKFAIFLNASKKKEGEKYPASVIVNYEKFCKKDDKQTMELLKKNNNVVVSGFFDVDSYTDKDGNLVKKEKRVVTEVKPFQKEEDGNNQDK